MSAAKRDEALFRIPGPVWSGTLPAAVVGDAGLRRSASPRASIPWLARFAVLGFLFRWPR